MIRVFDVLEDQLPVAGDLLAHVSENSERTPIEYALEVMRHQLTEVFSDRTHLAIERSEDHSVERFHF